MCDLGAHFQRIAVGDEQVRHLAWFEAAELIGDAEDFGGIDRQRLQRFVARQTPGYRFSGVVRQLPDVGAVADAARRWALSPTPPAASAIFTPARTSSPAA